MKDGGTAAAPGSLRGKGYRVARLVDLGDNRIDAREPISDIDGQALVYAVICG